MVRLRWSKKKAKRYAGAGSRFAQSMGRVGENSKFSQTMGTLGNLFSSAQNFMRYQQGGSVSGPRVLLVRNQPMGNCPRFWEWRPVPDSLPVGSFVLNRKATETMQEVANGGLLRSAAPRFSELGEEILRGK